MDVHVNYLAVLLAAVLSMVVGSLWYMPASFGTMWTKFSGVKLDRTKMTRENMAIMYGSVFIASLVMAYVLAYFTSISNFFFQDNVLHDAISSALLLWLGFTAARLYVHDTFEFRRKKLTLLNSGHELVTVLVMALIIGLLR